MTTASSSAGSQSTDNDNSKCRKTKCPTFLLTPRRLAGGTASLDGISLFLWDTSFPLFAHTRTHALPYACAHSRRCETKVSHEYVDTNGGANSSNGGRTAPDTDLCLVGICGEVFCWDVLMSRTPRCQRVTCTPTTGIGVLTAPRRSATRFATSGICSTSTAGCVTCSRASSTADCCRREWFSKRL